MSLRPQLNVVCGRCGKPRGLAHTCLSGGKRKATLKPQVTFGKCPKCKKPRGNPLTHVCRPKSDFRRRKAAHEKAQRAAARKKRQKAAHDYQACTDNDCRRALCVAYKAGYTAGNLDGYEHGHRVGRDLGAAEASARPRF